VNGLPTPGAGGAFTGDREDGHGGLARRRRARGGLTDPEGDDDGPGTSRCPTAPAFNDGTFDLTGMEVFTAGDHGRFVPRIAETSRTRSAATRSRSSA
jgi:hypothetical protein